MAKMSKAPDKEKQALGALLMQLEQQSQLDQAFFLAANSKEIIKSMKETLKQAKGSQGEIKQRVLNEILNLGQETLSLTQISFPDERDQKFFNSRLLPIAKTSFYQLAQFAEADEDKNVKKFAKVFKAYYYMAKGDTGAALQTFKEITHVGYAKLGEGDVKKGKEKFSQLTQEAEKLAQAGKMEEAKKILRDLDPGMVDAHEFLQRIESARMTRIQGFKDLGEGDVGKGRAKVNSIMAEVKKIESEGQALMSEFKKLVAEKKEDEAKKKLEEIQKKMTEGEKLLKELPKGFVEAYQLVEQIEAIQLKKLNKGVLAVWSAFSDGQNAQAREEADGVFRTLAGGFAASFRSMFGDDKTHHHDLSEAYQRDIDVWQEALHLTRAGKARSVRAALVEIEKTGVGTGEQATATKARATELLNKSEEGFSLITVLDYAAKPNPNAEESKALLETARELENNPHMVKTAQAIIRLVAETSEDPGVKKLALSYLGGGQKAA